MRLAALLLLSLLVAPASLARDRAGDGAQTEAPGAISGGTVKLWDPMRQLLTISLGKKQEIELRTVGALIQGPLGEGRVVDVTYTGDRANVVSVRP